ncbi:hypothetical protein EYZ11_006036 [Aspergillus tanneri]|uniref:Chromo domain-containing protein n=1 Tax=Aspergillus tanneri TaxID=1220188 RepID=A0A4S3JME1_9EURO|nr:hypothetical protein EYZ11_006036 [Aspergillus tanneri]
MLRHQLTCDPNASWVSFLPSFISTINGTANASTKASPHRLLFGMDLRRPWNAVKEYLGGQDFSSRVDAEEALAFASLRMKEIYDRRHEKPPVFKPDDKVTIRLHKGYSIPAAKRFGRKLSQQYSAPLEVIKRVGRSAYRLRLPASRKIHPVISVAQLEPVPDPQSDPFGRAPACPPPVTDERFPDQIDRWEVERILNKRIVRIGRNRTPFTEYLVRWKGYSSEEDQWVRTKDIAADELIEECFLFPVPLSLNCYHPSSH